MEKSREVVIGVDLGGTKVAGALFMKDGSLLAKSSRKLNNREGDEVGYLIVDLIRDLLNGAKLNDFRVKAIGICVPGIFNKESATVWAPNIPGWNNYGLKALISREIKGEEITIAVDNDRSCSMLAEVWKGNAGECSNALFLTVGTGIGLGILANGKIINGADGAAGAIGWLVMESEYTQINRQNGNLEQYASGDGIARYATELLEKHRDLVSGLRNVPKDLLSAEDVFRAYENGDKLALIALEKAVEYWGMCTANLISIFNPEKVFFGGGVFGPGTQFIGDIIAATHRWAQPIGARKVVVEASGLGGDAGLIGAGYLAITSQEHKAG